MYCGVNFRSENRMRLISMRVVILSKHEKLANRNSKFPGIIWSDDRHFFK